MSAKKPTEQDVITLYCLIGKAVYAAQLLEEAISHSIVLKRDIKVPYCVSREKGDRFLKKYRSYTLGDAINLANEENIYPEPLLQALKKFGTERNWLIHKCVRNEDEMLSDANKSRLIAIGEKALILRLSIEEDMMAYSESMGLDMSHARAAIQKHYQES